MKVSNDVLNQFSSIVDFCLSCVFKDQVEADKHEIEENSNRVTEYLLAYSREDNLTQEERDIITSSYVEENKYYKFLQEAYGIEPFIARTLDDFSLLHYNNDLVQQSPYLFNYISIYRECRNAFYKTSYTPSMDDMPNYRNLCLLTINLNTIIKMNSYWLTNYFDIDMMTDEQVDNFMFSFGISYFRNLPSNYKRKIAKNLNKLLSRKGSDQVILDILDIFEFNDIEIYKYYLVNKSVSLQNNRYQIVDKPRFFSHNIKIPSLPMAIKSGDYKEESIQSVTQGDDHWHIVNEDIREKDFDYAMTKYFSIEFGNDSGRNSSLTTYFLNLIEMIRIHHTMQEDLYLYINRYTSKKISLYDTIVLLQTMVNLHYRRNLRTNVEGSKYSPIEYSIPNVSYASEYPTLNIPPEYQVKTIPKDGIIDYYVVDAVFKQNMDALNYAKKRLKESSTYKEYKMLLEYYRKQFFDSFNNTMSIKADKFNTYFKDKFPEITSLIDSILDIEDDSVYYKTLEEHILYLSDVINTFCANQELTFSSLGNEILSKYLRQVINVFKAFTITIRNLDSAMELRDDLVEFKLLDDVKLAYSKLDVRDQFVLMDYIQSIAKVDLNDRLYLFDYLRSIDNRISFDDYFNFRDDYLLHNVLQYVGNLNFKDKFNMEYDCSVIENIVFNDSFDYSMIKAFIKEKFNVNDTHSMMKLLPLKDKISLGIKLNEISKLEIPDKLFLSDRFTIKTR